MSFFDDFASVVKDIGTSVTRIVTDTAIDLANVTTGFQFDDEMEKAKQSMSDAGLYSASDAIERNHYGFLKDMQKDAQHKNDRLAQLYKEGEEVSSELNSRTVQFTIMVDGLDLLSSQMESYEQLVKQYEHYPAWHAELQKHHVDIIPLSKINEYHNTWQEVGHWMETSGLIVNGANALSGLSGLAAAARAARLIKASRIASAAKFTKFASVAGKASFVLTIATVGLDIGLSVVQLEDRKKRLQDYLEEVDEELNRAAGEISNFRAEITETQTLIDRLLETAGLKNLCEWDGWVASEEAKIAKARDVMITLGGAIARAENTVKENPDYSESRLIRLISAADPDLSEDLIKQIIQRVKSIPREVVD